MQNGALGRGTFKMLPEEAGSAFLKNKNAQVSQREGEAKEPPTLSFVKGIKLVQSLLDIKFWVLLVNLENRVSNLIDSSSRNKIPRNSLKQRFQNDFKLVFQF